MHGQLTFVQVVLDCIYKSYKWSSKMCSSKVSTSISVQLLPQIFSMMDCDLEVLDK